MTASPTQFSVHSWKYLATPSSSSTTSASAWDTCYKPGPAVHLCPSPNLALTNSEQSPSPPVSVKYLNASSSYVSCSGYRTNLRPNCMASCPIEERTIASWSYEHTLVSPASVVAFIDLKSAFDIANKDIIHDQLVDFGIKGNILRCICGYLRNRTSRVLFEGALSTIGNP